MPHYDNSKNILPLLLLCDFQKKNLRDMSPPFFGHIGTTRFAAPFSVSISCQETNVGVCCGKLSSKDIITMYETYWGFREKPFKNTPDPRFLYTSDQQNGCPQQFG